MNEPYKRTTDFIPQIKDSYGPCTNFKKCNQIGELGNGLCIFCWDKKSDGRLQEKYNIEDIRPSDKVISYVNFAGENKKE